MVQRRSTPCCLHVEPAALYLQYVEDQHPLNVYTSVADRNGINYLPPYRSRMMGSKKKVTVPLGATTSSEYDTTTHLLMYVLHLLYTP